MRIAFCLALTVCSAGVASAQVAAPISRPPTPLDAAAEQAARTAAALGAPLSTPTPTANPTGNPTPTSTGNPTPTPTTVAVAPAKPQAPPTTGLLGVDFETLAFFERTDWVSPAPELVLGYGNEGFRLALLVGAMLGKTTGYTAGLRLAGGWEAHPVGYQLGIDLLFTYVPGAAVSHPGIPGGSQQDVVDFSALANLVDVTYRYKSLLFELRAVSVGESYDFYQGAYAPSLGGGVAVSWL